MAEQALQEREEYQRVLEWQRSQAEQDQDRVRETKAAASMYRTGLKGQIMAREKAKAIERQRFLAEGEAMAAQMAAEKQKLLRIKQQKLGALEAAGVPVKYRAELNKKKVACLFLRNILAPVLILCPPLFYYVGHGVNNPPVSLKLNK